MTYEERPTWEQVFPALTSEGFFTKLKQALGSKCPIYFDDTGILDIGVNQIGYGRRIGVLWDVVENDPGYTSLNDVIVTTTYKVYEQSWQRLYTALTSEYNPINNYSMTESGEDTRTNTGTQSTSGTRSGTETETPNLTNTTTGENNSSGGLYGFNSAESVPSDTTHGTNTNTNTQSGTVNTDTSDTTSSTRTDDLTEKSVHTFERSGNIGVTTSQQMIESEIELRKNQFYDIVFHDIINYVCLHVY